MNFCVSIFRKETNFNEVSDSIVAKAIKLLNDRPKKLLEKKNASIFNAATNGGLSGLNRYALRS
jgi:IS30 family transposase